MNKTNPFIKQQVGITPTISERFKYTQDSTTSSLMSFVVGQIVMFIYFGILIHMVQQIAGEKETKSREGMKMMGLMDSTYYLGWFILYSLISGFNALVISICLITQLDKINPVFIFMFVFSYGLTIFGSAWIIVALIPSPTGSTLLAILYHLISFYIGAAINTSIQSSTTLYVLSLFPNIAMSQVVKQIFFYQNLTNDGL